jgi:predicted RNA polymerase sigma factor
VNEGPLDAAAVDAVRTAAPRVLGALLRRGGDFAAAEDAVQEALLDALSAWPNSGLPGNPAGWLFQVACRRLADGRDAGAARRRREEAVAEAAARRVAPPPRDPDAGDEDDSLFLLELCCHPALAPASAIALTLRAVGGLTTAEVARAFLSTEAATAQRIGRAKRTIKEAGGTFDASAPHDRRRRTAAVRRVLYLMFNEGYAAAAGDALVREDLSSEAIRLARLLLRLDPGDPESEGLLALMLLTDARRAARTGPGGALVPLDEQDRRLWDRGLVDEGSRLVATALARGAVGPYQAQAAIAALHDEAPDVASTDWPQILALYDLQLRMEDQPMVALNRVVALAMVRGPAAGLAALDSVAADARLAGHFRVTALRGHLLVRSGEHGRAAAAFAEAAAQAENARERAYLEAKAAAAEAAARGG